MIAGHAMVVLNFDKPTYGLFAGDVGAVVDVYSNGAAYEVEFVDGDGTTVACVTLDAKDARSIDRGEVLHTRRRDDGTNKMLDPSGGPTAS